LEEEVVVELPFLVDLVVEPSYLVHLEVQEEVAH
jgi:hypothetical protein